MIHKFSKYINLGVVAFFSFCTASIANSFITQKLNVDPTLEQKYQSQSITRSKPRNPDYFKSINERNIFNSKAQNAPPEIEKPVQQEVLEGPIEKSKLQAKLIGTIVGETDSTSSALIQDLTSRKTNVYRVNDQLQDAKIIKVERNRTILLRNGIQEALEVEKTKSKRGKRSTKRAPSASETEVGVRMVSEDTFVVDRREVDNAFANLNQLATQARIVPNFSGGKANGFKLFSIRPNSLYDKIGLKNGDVIQRVNGMDLDSPEKGLQIYQQLQNSTEISIDLLRHKQKKSLTYQIR